MIRVICPHCGSKLNAKEEIIGQTRKCPKCANPVKIVPPSPAAPAPAPIAPKPVAPVSPPKEIASSATPESVPLENEAAHAEVSEHLPVMNLPIRLNRDSHYLICDRTHVVAMWENNGNGWQFRVGGGFIGARRTRENLPSQGDFKLVELRFEKTADSKHLAGLTFYQLATRWAVTALGQDEDDIISKLTGPVALNRDQKNAVRQSLKEHLMREVWGSNTAVIDYLGSADCHSHSVG
jgi:hypothetical protein